MIWRPGLSMEDIKNQVIMEALEYFDYNRAKTAEALDISLRGLGLRIRKYQLPQSRQWKEDVDKKRV